MEILIKLVVGQNWNKKPSVFMIPETTFVRDPMYPQSFCVRDFSVYFGSPSGSIDADMQFLALLEYLEFP